MNIYIYVVDKQYIGSAVFRNSQKLVLVMVSHVYYGGLGCVQVSAKPNNNNHNCGSARKSVIPT